MAVINGESYLPGGSYSTVGELRLKQRNPLAHKGVEETWNTPVITQGSLSPTDYDFRNVFNKYSQRNRKFNSAWVIKQLLYRILTWLT